MKAKYTIILLLAVACAGAYMLIGTSTPAVSQDDTAPMFTARQSVVNGRVVGDVVAGNEVVFRVRTSAGGYSPLQRAQIIASRLDQITADGNLQPSDITIGTVRGQEVVMARGEVVATADRDHARLNNSTPSRLAYAWAGRLSNVVAGRPVDTPASVARSVPATVGTAGRVRETPTSQRIVPIISVGRGTRVGGAVVAGARDRVDDVRAVAQVEGQFGDAVRLRILIPVSSEDVVRNIRRVPETSVIGLADIPL